MGIQGCADAGMQGCEAVRASFLTWKILTAPQTHLPCVPESESCSLSSISPHDIHPTKFSFESIKANTVRKKNQTSRRLCCACSNLSAASDEKGLGTCLASALKELAESCPRQALAQLWLSSPCLSQEPGWPDCSPAACPSQAQPRGQRWVLGAWGNNVLHLLPRCKEVFTKA